MSKQDCTGTFEDSTGTVQERIWSNYKLNFDNLGNAFLALFVTVSLDGYAGLLIQAVSAPNTKDQAPQVCHQLLSVIGSVGADSGRGTQTAYSGHV